LKYLSVRASQSTHPPSLGKMLTVLRPLEILRMMISERQCRKPLSRSGLFPARSLKINSERLFGPRLARKMNLNLSLSKSFLLYQVGIGSCMISAFLFKIAVMELKIRLLWCYMPIRLLIRQWYQAFSLQYNSNFSSFSVYHKTHKRCSSYYIPNAIINCSLQPEVRGAHARCSFGVLNRCICHIE
jgi:hypothetical protein